jgi:hypothetical protein
MAHHVRQSSGFRELDETDIKSSAPVNVKVEGLASKHHASLVITKVCQVIHLNYKF